MTPPIPPERIQDALAQFWSQRDAQTAKLDDGGKSGGSARAARHLKGFEQLVADYFVELGIPPSCITSGSPTLPGYYRVAKKWDLAVVYEGHLLAALEFKSQVGSVGKNYNNRFEEALGSASDVQAAQREYKAFGSLPPWLAYVFVLQESDETEGAVRTPKALFRTDTVFDGLSYNQRYQTMITRFLNDHVYHAAWFLTTRRDSSGSITFSEPLPTACAATLAEAISGRVNYVKAAARAAGRG